MKEISVADIVVDCLCVYKFVNAELEDVVSDKYTVAYRLAYLAEGKMEFIVDGKSYALSGGDLFYLPSDTRYTTRFFGKNVMLYNVHFVLQKNEREYRDELHFPPFSNEENAFRFHCGDCAALNACKLQKKAFLDEEFAEIEKEYFKRSIFSMLKINARVALVLLRLLEDQPVRRNKTLCKKVLDYIDGNIFTDISCKSIAEYFNYHSNYLNKVVKLGVGQGLHSCIMISKCNAAAKLLLETDKSITEIAQDLYFSDSSHFANVFSRIMRCTPSEYRKMYY